MGDGVSEFRHFAKLHNAQDGHAVLQRLWTVVKPWLLAGHVLEVRVKQESRTLDQNAAQWPYLQAFSEQLQWPINGSMAHMEPDDWKDVLTAAFQNETVRLAMGMSGGVVMLGMRTSKMSKARFSEWITFLQATAAMRGVKVYQGDAE